MMIETASGSSSRQLHYDPKELVGRTPLGLPVLRESDLPDNPSNFEILVAAPSDDELHTMWTVWSIVFAVYSVIILVVFLGIVCSKRVRKQIFNHYLIYLMLPDIMYTVMCTVQCGALAITGGQNTPASCRLQSFYLIFGNGANSWMNAIIANQIHSLLKTSSRGERYVPPTKRQVAQQACCAYAFSAFIAILGILPLSVGIPLMTVPFYGLGCVTVNYDTQESNLFFWLFYYPAFAAAPMLYLIYVTIDIWRKKLLPRKGRRRQLSLYYVRILVAVYIMWFPALVTIYGVSVGAWPFVLVGLWIHAQGAVSALCSLMKEDIYRAVRNLLCCRCYEENEIIEDRPRSASSHGCGAGTARQERQQRGLQRRNSFLQISGVLSQEVMISSASGDSIDDSSRHELNSTANRVSSMGKRSAQDDLDSIDEDPIVDDWSFSSDVVDDDENKEEDSASLTGDCSLPETIPPDASSIPMLVDRSESSIYVDDPTIEEIFETLLNDLEECSDEDAPRFDVEKCEKAIAGNYK